MKSGLHWQILIGLILGISFGINFPTNYKITDSTITHLEKEHLPGEIIHILQNEKKDFTETETEFLKRIKPALGPEFFEKYKHGIISESKYNPYIAYISWFGELFLRALKMIVIPLVLTSIISGMSNISEEDKLGKLSIKTIMYYIMASSLAILTGLGFVNLIKPGIGIDMGYILPVQGLVEEISFKDFFMNIVPNNIFESLASGNLLSIIFFSILFGFYITKVSDRYRIFLNHFFNAAYDVLLKLANFIIRFTPLGVFSIIASFVADQVGDTEKLFFILSSLENYIITILVGLLFHSIVSLPLILRIGFKINPWKHFKALRSALMAAFTTCSPSATLSLTMSSVQNNCGVSNKISSFTLPLGTAVNMDGTALYECVAALFIAQAYGIELSLSDQLIVVAISLLVSIGTAGIPMASFATISIILTAVGLPLEGIGLIFSVDRMMDMFRTAVNVWSHSCCAVIVAKSEAETLKI